MIGSVCCCKGSSSLNRIGSYCFFLLLSLSCIAQPAYPTTDIVGRSFRSPNKKAFLDYWGITNSGGVSVTNNFYYYYTNIVNYTNTTYVTNDVPAGIITLWNDGTNSIPSGWLLCDGNNGTPNLSTNLYAGLYWIMRGTATPSLYDYLILNGGEYLILNDGSKLIMQ